MSVTTPYTSVYGSLVGRGQVEASVLATLRTWIIPYIAEYERQNGLAARSLIVPPTPESIHGDIDDERYSAELFPEIVVVVQSTGEPEREEAGLYGSWFSVQASAFVQVVGDQDATRTLADAYGTALEGIVTQQGAFGYIAPNGKFSPVPVDAGTPFATRTRLWAAPRVDFPDSNVRDIISTAVMARTYIASLVSDFDGPRIPPLDPYASPESWPLADKVEIDLIRGTPDTFGIVTADAVEIDGTVVPPVTRFEQVQVDEP